MLAAYKLIPKPPAFVDKINILYFYSLLNLSINYYLSYSFILPSILKYFKFNVFKNFSNKFKIPIN